MLALLFLFPVRNSLVKLDKIRLMKILHVCETCKGGIGTYFSLLHRFPPKGVENSFLIPNFHAGSLADDLPLSTYAATKRGVGCILAMCRALRRFLKSANPDAVFFHSSLSLLGLVFVRVIGWRGVAIYAAHGWAGARERKSKLSLRIVRWFEARLVAQANLVVNVSEADAIFAQRQGYKGHHVIIENAVADVRAGQISARAAKDDTISLLFVGRFDEQKGIDILLEAFAAARKRRSDLHLLLVGGAVRGDAALLSLPEGASAVGWVKTDEIDQYYAAADALVVPSRWEGLPLVIPEALRNGTPVLCSRRSGMEKLINEGRSGYSFEPDASALADLFCSLGRDWLTRSRTEARSQYESRFDIAVWRDAISRAYASLGLVA